MILVHPDDAEETISEMKALNSGKKTFSFENRYRHKDGHYVMLAWSAIANTSSHQIHAVAKDITEEKAYHQALVKIGGELQSPFGKCKPHYCYLRF